MEALKKLVVAVLLAVWLFPGVSAAKPPQAPSYTPPPAPVVALANAGSNAAPASSPSPGETGKLAQREQQSQDLNNFRGGAVYIYLSGGVILVLIIILLIILL